MPSTSMRRIRDIFGSTEIPFLHAMGAHVPKLVPLGVHSTPVLLTADVELFDGFLLHADVTHASVTIYVKVDDDSWTEEHLHARIDEGHLSIGRPSGLIPRAGLVALGKAIEEAFRLRLGAFYASYLDAVDTAIADGIVSGRMKSLEATDINDLIDLFRAFYAMDEADAGDEERTLERAPAPPLPPESFANGKTMTEPCAPSTPPAFALRVPPSSRPGFTEAEARIAAENAAEENARAHGGDIHF